MNNFAKSKADDITFLIVTYKSEESINECINSIPNKYPILVIENSADNFFKSNLEKNIIMLNVSSLEKI